MKVVRESYLALFQISAPRAHKRQTAPARSTWSIGGKNDRCRTCYSVQTGLNLSKASMLGLGLHARSLSCCLLLFLTFGCGTPSGS